MNISIKYFMKNKTSLTCFDTHLLAYTVLENKSLPTILQTCNINEDKHHYISGLAEDLNKFCTSTVSTTETLKKVSFNHEYLTIFYDYVTYIVLFVLCV